MKGDEWEDGYAQRVAFLGLLGKVVDHEYEEENDESPAQGEVNQAKERH